MLRYTAALLLALLFLILVPYPSGAIKPRPPIELSFSYRYLSETEVRIALIAKANVAGLKVNMNLEIPLGLRLIKGEERWEGSMKRREQKKIEVSVRLGASSSYEILGKASIHLIKGGIFTQERRLVLDASGENTLNHRPPTLHKGPRGNILEFRE